MAKDPAVLLYHDKFISATNGMRASFRAWYMDLIIYQYDKGSIPNDMDEIAGICRVRPSEYDLFQQMLDQVLKQKFSINENNQWENKTAKELLSKRQNYVDKRARAANIGVITKMCANIKGFEKKHIEKLKKELFRKTNEEVIGYKNKNLLEQVLNLYINEDVNEDKGIIGNKGFEKSEKLFETDSKFLKTVCVFFSQTTEVLEMRVHGFLNVIENTGKMGEFKKQTEAYMNYKTESGEQKHRWANYVTEWDQQDWVMMLENLPDTNKQEKGVKKLVSNR